MLDQGLGILLLPMWTIGHSTRPIEAFIELLRSQQIQFVVDVRRFPGSRMHPQFNSGPLENSLTAANIGYRSAPELGGRRTPRRDSRNTAWKNASFRGYADYMETAAFTAGLERLIADAGKQRTAIMCAEAVWWQCHRSLIADALKVRSVEVLHILDGPKIAEHPYTAVARVVDGRLDYGGAPRTADLFQDNE
jgi:uncharacterized protein (DUF488 family)